MAKWTGGIRTTKRWFRSPKYLVEFRKEEGDHNPPNSPELYWCEVDALRLDLIAFDLACRRREIEELTEENARLRAKLIRAGSDPKPDDVDLRTVADCKRRFGEEELESPSLRPTRVLTEEEKTRPAHPPKGR